jgi:hypothetical protein
MSDIHIWHTSKNRHTNQQMTRRHFFAFITYIQVPGSIIYDMYLTFTNRKVFRRQDVLNVSVCTRVCIKDVYNRKVFRRQDVPNVSCVDKGMHQGCVSRTCNSCDCGDLHVGLWSAQDQEGYRVVHATICNAALIFI